MSIASTKPFLFHCTLFSKGLRYYHDITFSRNKKICNGRDQLEEEEEVEEREEREEEKEEEEEEEEEKEEEQNKGFK